MQIWATADVFHITGASPLKEMVLNGDDRLNEIFAYGLKSAASVACHWSVRLHPYSSIIIMAVWVVSLVSLSMPLQKKKKTPLCVSCVWLRVSSHLQPGPPTAEANLLATKWRTSLNGHPVASCTPRPSHPDLCCLLRVGGAHYGTWHSLWKFKTCLDVRCEGMFAWFLIFSGVTKNKDMHSMKRFIASITPDTCKFLEKRTKQRQIKSAMACKWGRKIRLWSQ